jgi:hypothetical protein
VIATVVGRAVVTVTVTVIAEEAGEVEILAVEVLIVAGNYRKLE